MKKLVALLLCGILTASMLTGCGDSKSDGAAGNAAQESDGGYEETIPFTMTNYFSVWCYSGVPDYKDATYQYIVDRFNIEPDVWACTDDEAEKTRMWINGGTMPDAMWWESFNLPEYYSYVDQGLLQALPDGWETRWPNINQVVQSSGMAELIKVDGKTYVIPHAITGLYLKSDGGALNSLTLYYRKDWAKEVGMEDFGSDYQVTVSELREYLEKVTDAGLAQKAISANADNLRNMFYHINGVSFDEFKETEDGFVWVPGTQEAQNAIAMMQDWYQAGLIDPEFYLQDYTCSITYNDFVNGKLAAFPWAGAVVDAQTFMDSCNDGFAQGSANDMVGLVHVTGDDGVSYANSTYNYWGTHVFSPETDEKTLERILDLIDWISSDEGFTTYCMGVPGEDWEFDEDGNFTLLNPDAAFRRDIDVFAYFGYCQDDFSYSGNQEGLGEDTLESVMGVQNVKTSGTLFYASDNYTRHTSEAKNNYSMKVIDKQTEIVVEGLDVESSWAEYAEENKSIWEPLLNELNDTYY